MGFRWWWISCGAVGVPLWRWWVCYNFFFFFWVLLEYFGFIAMNLVEFWHGFLVGCGGFDVRERERERVCVCHREELVKRQV